MGHNLGQDTACLGHLGAWRARTGDGAGAPRSSSTEASSPTCITHRVVGAKSNVCDCEATRTHAEAALFLGALPRPRAIPPGCSWCLESLRLQHRAHACLPVCVSCSTLGSGESGPGTLWTAAAVGPGAVPPGVRQCLWAPLRAARASEETRGGCRPEGLGPGLHCGCEALPRVTPESQSYPYKWRPSPLGRAWASETAHVLCQWRGAALGSQARTTMPHSSPSLHCQWSSNERGQELICKCYK